MPSGGVTVTGLKEARAAVARLPEAVTNALKAVAKRTAEGIAVESARLLLAQTKAVKTAASIRVLEELEEKQYVVNEPGHPDDPANLPLWLERGTRKMSAKPHQRPAGDAANARYQHEMAVAAEQAVKGAIE